MQIADAQREMRSAFLGGLAGQLIAGLIWAASAAAGSWVAPGVGMAVLFFGSMLLFPLTQLTLRGMGRPARLSEGNTLGQLAMQIAFTVPIGFLLVGAATLYGQCWFFPASMVIVGAHYLPFIFLYGMPHFGVLAGVLVVGGTGLALYDPDLFSIGGWVSASVFVIFAFVGRAAVLREERAAHGNP